MLMSALETLRVEDAGPGNDGISVAGTDVTVDIGRAAVSTLRGENDCAIGSCVDDEFDTSTGVVEAIVPHVVLGIGEGDK